MPLTDVTSAPLSPQVPVAAPHDRRWIIAAAVLALVARVIAIFVLRTWDYQHAVGLQFHNFPFGAETGSIARSLALGQGFGSPFLDITTGPSAWIAPVYPALVALVFKIFGVLSVRSEVVMFIINSIFAAATCFPLYAVGRRTVGRGVALWSVWIWALCPFFWRWPISWVWEISLSALLFTTVFWMALRLRESGGGSLSRPNGSETRSHTTLFWAGFGAFWGLCALINPSLLPFAPISALWAAWPQLRSFRGWMRTCVLSGAVCVLVMMPWMIRNRLVLGQWSFVRDNFGFELYLGNYATSNGMGWGGRHPTANPRMFAEYQQIGEVRFVEKYGAIARQFIHDDPGAFLRLCGVRFLAFWDGSSLIYWPKSTEWWRTWMFWPLSLLALLGGIVALLRQVRAAWMYVLGILLYPIAYYVTYPQVRYRHAVEPLMLLLAVYFLGTIFRKDKRLAISD